MLKLAGGSLRHVLGVERPGQMEALCPWAALFREECELLLALDAFRNVIPSERTSSRAADTSRAAPSSSGARASSMRSSFTTSTGISRSLIRDE